MPETYFSRLADQHVAGWIRAAVEWCETQLSMSARTNADVDEDLAAKPNWPLISVLAALTLYIGLLLAGWAAAAQWVLAALVVVATLAVAVQLLAELDDGFDKWWPPRYEGFSDDPDELDAQLAELRPAVVQVPTELPVYAQCCNSLGFNPFAGAGVR